MMLWIIAVLAIAALMIAATTLGRRFRGQKVLIAILFLVLGIAALAFGIYTLSAMETQGQFSAAAGEGRVIAFGVVCAGIGVGGLYRHFKTGDS